MIYFPFMHAGAMPTFLHTKELLWLCGMDWGGYTFWAHLSRWILLDGKVSRVKQFFNTTILPELVGSSIPKVQNLAVPQILQLNHYRAQSAVDMAKFCYCQRPEEGDMVGCDSPSCEYEWFHLCCLKPRSLPTSKHWYCPDCRKLPCFKRKRSKKL